MPTPEELLAPPDPSLLPGGGLPPPPMPPETQAAPALPSWPGVSDELTGPSLPLGAGPPGEPMPWPNPAWLSGYQGQDVPEVPNPNAPVVQPPPEEAAQAGQPEATAQAGPQAMAALDQAREAGTGKTYATPEGGKNAPQASTGDAVLDEYNRLGRQTEQGFKNEVQAQREKNEYVRTEGLKAAEARAAAQERADAEYMAAQNEAKAKRAELDKQAQDIAQQKIDPRRAWHSMSFGAQVGVAVIAALNGATTRSVQTGQNSVVDAVQKMAERDMQAQAMDLENATRAIGVRRGLLADDLAAGHDILDFRYKSMNAAYDMAMDHIKTYAMQYDNDILNAQAQQHIAALQQAKMENQIKYEDQLVRRNLEVKRFKDESARGWYGLGLQKRHLDIEEEKAKNKGLSVRDQIQLSKEQRAQQEYMDKRLIPGAKTKEGGDLYILDERDAPKLKDKMEMVTSMNQKFDRLEEIYAKHGWKPFKEWSFWDPQAAEDAKEARLIMGNILPEWSTANDQGVIRDKEYPMYFKMFGDPNGLIDPRTNFKKMRQMSTQQINNELRQKSRNQDVAWWEPERAAQGNEGMNTDDEEIQKFKERQREQEEQRADRMAPRESWENVEISPDGKWYLTAGGIKIPAGRQIVGQKTRVNNGGRKVDTYTLDNGDTFDIEE